MRKIILFVIVGLLCSGLLPAGSLAAGEFRARDGNGWSLTADGVLTIENNAGWRDGLKHSVDEKVNKLVIGKNLTKFYLYDEMFEKVEPDFQFPYEVFTDKDGEKYYSDGVYCPWLQPKEIEVQDGNPVFSVEDGLLINNKNHTVVLADADQKAFVIPEGVTTIGTWAFREREVETVQFPSTLQTIGFLSFCDCKNLETPVFPSTLSWIGDYAFCDCSNVKEIQLSGNVEYIGESAFNSCSIRTLILPDNIQEIGSRCFEGCQRLETVRWPANLKTIGYQIFKDCTNLQAVDLPEGLETIGAEAFQGCENLAQITLPSTLTVIGDDAFHGCEKLTDITLPESLQEIGSGAFFSTDFSLIEFSKTIKAGSYAFGYVHIAVFSGSENEFGKRFSRSPGEFVFLGTPPRNFPEYKIDDIHQDVPQVFYTEEYAEAWKPIAANGLNGWPTQCISVEEAQTRIAQAAVPTPEPTADEGPWATDAILDMHISTPEPYTRPDQPTEETKTDPLVYVFAGLLALVVVGIVVVGVRARKKQETGSRHTAKL